MAPTRPACSSPTIPAWKWTRWAALPACTPPASPGPAPPTNPTTACCSKKLRGVEDRRARFVCAIALVDNGRVAGVYTGSVEGIILDAPRGAGGFGYDPLFYYPPFGCTFGEVEGERKFAVSHRGQALRAMLQALS